MEPVTVGWGHEELAAFGLVGDHCGRAADAVVARALDQDNAVASAGDAGAAAADRRDYRVGGDVGQAAGAAGGAAATATLKAEKV